MAKRLHKLPAKCLSALYPKFWVIVLIGSILAGKGCHCSSAQPAKVIQVCFSPNGQCMQLVKETINKAQHTILVQAYYFTSLTMANALIEAHQRGIAVKLLIDRSQLTAQGSKLRLVAKKGIPVWIDFVPGIAHNKVLIIDEEYVLTGSFNWTDAAQKRNAENLILIQDRHTNQKYKDNWEQRAAKAQQFI